MRIMFKSGDDLRQDQLIMQLMQLMDGLLRKVGTWYLYITIYLLQLRYYLHFYMYDVY